MNLLRYIGRLAALLVFVFTGAALASDEEIWQSIFNSLPAEKEIIHGREQRGKLYNANLIYTVRTRDGRDGVFRRNDNVDLRIESDVLPDLTFAGTKKELIDWSKANKASLFKAIFGNAPEVTSSGSSSTQAMAQAAFMSPVYTAPTSVTRTTSSAPASSTSSQTGHGDSGAGEGEFASASGASDSEGSTEGSSEERVSFVPISNKDIVVSGQRDSIAIGSDKGSGSSGIMAYEWRFGESRAYSAGITIPYRQLEMKDNLDTKYKNAALMPFVKKRWYRMNGVVEWMANATFGITYLDSKIFSDGSGYVEFGGGTGVRYSHALSPTAIVNAGVLFQSLKKEIPGDFVSDEVRWIADALNNLPWEYSLIPSVGGVMNLLNDKITLKAEIFRVHQLQSDVAPGYENQTVVFGMATVKPLNWLSLSLGYKETFELKNVTSKSYILDFKISW